MHMLTVTQNLDYNNSLRTLFERMHEKKNTGKGVNGKLT
jgi:hypothetical protein